MEKWKTLNLEPTDDKKAVQKAYAKLVAQYHPEEYPEVFQRINRAYLDIMKLLKKNKTNSFVSLYGRQWDKVYDGGQNRRKCNS